LAFGLAASLGQGCCITFDDQSMQLALETAIVVWDAERKVEHFIRRADFIGKAKDFGFIFPSPTQPFRIAVANEGAFVALEQFRPRAPGIGCSKEEPAGATDAVEVLEEKRVGDFKATVFRAKDGAAITNWLKAQGHRTRPAMTPWFDHYAKKDWVFTALKYQGKNGPTPTKALCISFKANEPFYPFKMPSDTFAPEAYRRIDLYVLSQTEMDASLTGGSGWKGERVWSTDLPHYAAVSLNKGLLSDSSALEIPNRLALTRFRNTPEAHVFDEDIVFRPSQSYAPFWIGGAVVAVVLLVWRSRRRKLAS